MTDPPSTLLSLVAIIGLVALAVYLARKKPLVSFAVFWFFGCLIIESSIIPLALVFEHRLYLPSMMLGLIPVSLCYRYIQSNWLRTALVCTAILVLCGWTYQRNRVWQSDATLWADVVKKSPNNAPAHLNLGVALSELGRTGQAVDHFIRALKIDPEFADAHYNLALAMERLGRTDQAVGHYLAALNIDPANANAHFNLGNILARQGKTDEAIARFEKAAAIAPDFVQSLGNLAMLYAAEKKYGKALAALKKVVALQPENTTACYNIAALYALQGNVEESVAWLVKAVDNGYRNWEMIETDEDLKNIRGSQAYKRLIESRR